MKNEIGKVVMFSSSLALIQGICERHHVEAIILETKHFNRDVYNLACLRSIPLFFADNQSELRKRLEGLPDCDLGVSFGFSLRFDSATRDFFRLGIWNIHAGRLPENRGRHPIVWDFLENARIFTVSIHEVDESFDRGFLLASQDIFREVRDTPLAVESRMLSAVTEKIFDDAVKAYFSGEKKPIGTGNYRKPIGESLSTVDPKTLDGLELYNIVMSQADFGGVKVGARVFTDCTFVHENFEDFYGDYYLVTSRDGKLIGLR